MLYCCNGKHFKKAELIIRKAGEKPLEYLRIIMRNGLVSSVSHGGKADNDRLTEHITLNFAEFNVEYVPQRDDGYGNAAIDIGWNIAANCSV